MKLRKILVPIDFGAVADRAVDLAIGLAEKFDARVELVHAFYLPPSVYAMDTALAPFPVDVVATRERQAFDAKLERARARYPRTTATWIDGEPRDAILHVAKQDAADLIVMGTHGRTGLARVVFGSVAARLIRTSPIPVLTTPVGASRGDERSPIVLRNILVPVDFGAPADHAVAVAAELASRFDAKLTVMHAYVVPPVPADVPPERFGVAAMHAAERGVEETIRRAKAGRVESFVVCGDARESIVDAVVQRGVDLVVMGTHQRRGLSRLFLGSVTEHVVRSSPAPVLTVGAEETRAAIAQDLI